ncbi:MAG: hypothetical protein ACO1QS_14285 [Verrucomicrobiota bacterium]
MPTMRGWLALAVGFAVAIVVPPLIPAYDGPGISPLQITISIFTAAVTAFICIRSFQSRRVADRVIAFLAAAFSVWMFYVFINRII